MSDHPMKMVKPTKYSQFHKTMNLQHKIVINKGMVKAMSYSELHEITNLDHHNNGGKSNVILRI